MQTYKVSDEVSPFQVKRHKLWIEVVEMRRWGKGYSCHVHWNPELWRLNGKKHPPEGWHPETRLWPASSEWLRGVGHDLLATEGIPTAHSIVDERKCHAR